MKILSALLAALSVTRISAGGVRAVDGSTKEQQQRSRHLQNAEELAIAWQTNDPNFADYSDELQIQRYTLALFYYATGGDNWENNTDWLDYEVPECEWFSKADPVCDENGIYLALHLDDNGLVGELPPELSLLSKLEMLELSINAIAGEIPTTLGGLSNLDYLNLGDNQLSGILPSELTNLVQLRRFALSINNLVGEIPTQIGLLTK